MIPLVVVENPKRWPFDMDGVEVVPARAYLTEPRYADMRRVTVFNVCRRYGYQSLGYYVSLLAAARGHRPSRRWPRSSPSASRRWSAWSPKSWMS